MQTKISVIIPTYNCGGHLEKCLQSVVRQNYKLIEIIIVDGKSDDNTLEVVEKYATPGFKIISEIDNGIYDAMNKGLDLATGEWLYFIGSDDFLPNQNIVSEIFASQDNSEYDIVYGNVLFKNSGAVYAGKFSDWKIINQNICHQAIFTRRTVFNKLGKFQTKYKSFADWAFNLGWFSDKSFKSKYVDKIIAIYNEHGYSFQNSDPEFCKDHPELIKRYFDLSLQ